MSAGDRYRNGKPKDYVRHLWAPIIEKDKGIRIVKTLWGRSDVGYASDDPSDVTCLKCLAKCEGRDVE